MAAVLVEAPWQPQRKTKKAHPKAGFSISKLTESYSPFLALQMLILAAPESQIQENGDFP
jgi:hypothetical protein